jgi:hypothetical protein
MMAGLLVVVGTAGLSAVGAPGAQVATAAAGGGQAYA